MPDARAERPLVLAMCWVVTYSAFESAEQSARTTLTARLPLQSSHPSFYRENLTFHQRSR
jgi:hypothetical protein